MSDGLVGSEVLVSMLAHAGMEVCFANPGTTEMHIVDALAADGRIRNILCLHETVVTGAADGYGRMLCKACMTLLHLGPGLANGLASLHNASRLPDPECGWRHGVMAHAVGCTADDGHRSSRTNCVEVDTHDQAIQKARDGCQ